MSRHSPESKGISIILYTVALVMLLCSLAANLHPDPVVRIAGRTVTVAIIIAGVLTYSGQTR